MGADDYVPASAPQRLLWTRLKVVLRRALSGVAGSEPAATLRCGALVLDRRSLHVRLGDRSALLTHSEFACLWLLLQRAGSTVSRDELTAAFGPLQRGPESRAVDTQIFRLRRKLRGVEPDRERIRSVRPVGYLFAP
jgi:DNA-binding response OmpR family regulator